MLDFSLGELMMIGAVALVVLGPERLPRVARGFGEMLGKAQRYVSQVRADFQREIELADLKRLQEEASSLEQAGQSVSETMAASEPTAPSATAWSASGWGSHRFRTRARPTPSLTDLTEAIEQMHGRTPMPPVRIGRNRYAPRARVNRPRIYR
jgi:Tat protein translocase TatB subunit